MPGGGAVAGGAVVVGVVVAAGAAGATGAVGAGRGPHAARTITSSKRGRIVICFTTIRSTCVLHYDRMNRRDGTKRLERVVAIALFLGTRRRVLAREVAERFGVSLRTVYRDMRALERAGYPVEGNAGDGYRLRQESYLRPLALTGDEAEALAIAARAPGAFGDALSRAATKLEAVLDPATRRRVIELQRRVVVPDFARSIGPSGELLAAIRECRVTRVVYRDARTNERSRRDVEPLGLVCMGDAWWLVAYCHLREDARAFRVDRLERADVTTTAFAARAGFTLAEIVARDAHLARELFGS
jgi:predicted DNA-binding transcriptional regulator YafY